MSCIHIYIQFLFKHFYNLCSVSVNIVHNGHFFYFFLMEDINIVFIALHCFWKHFWSVFVTAGYVFCYFFKWKRYTTLQVIRNSRAEGYSTAHRHSWLIVVWFITIIWRTVKQNTSEQSPTVLMPQALFLFQMTDILFVVSTAEANHSI